MKRMWMIRADGGGELLDIFLDRGLVAIGWPDVGSLDRFKTREEITDFIRNSLPDYKQTAVGMTVGQLFRFRHEISINDEVITYDRSRRVYHLGKITSDYNFNPTIDQDFPNQRAVTWCSEVLRDQLSVGTKNSLGAVSTLFQVPDEAAQEIRASAKSGNVEQSIDRGPALINDNEAQAQAIYKDIADRSLEFIKDEVSKLDWKQMQELVAGLLRSMGYKTKISAEGPDRGKDIIASPDGFGFEHPRIVVEVKHRSAPMGSNDLRSFLGGRHSSDKGLYVSTGGFTKDARYEADRANIPITLLDIDDLVEALIDNYDQLDIETKQLLPLKKLYLPA